MKRVTTGTEYEKWCASYLSRHGFHQITLTKATGDQGIDIIAVRHHKKYGIQCKFYDSPVGNSSVQEAYAGAAFYGCDQPAVMTNTVFTRGARQLAEETDVLLWPQKDPAAEKRFLKFYRTLRTMECLIGLGLFIYVILQAGILLREDITLCAILLVSAGLLGFTTDHSIPGNVAADLLDAGSILLIGILMQQGAWSSVFPWWIGCTFLLILSLFQLIQLSKAENAAQYEINQKLLAEDIQAQTEALGRKTGEILQDELHCQLEYLTGRKDNDILVFQYHADQNIADMIPTAEFAMNQYAAHDGIQDTYQILDMGRRKIQVSIHHSIQKAS
jgi:hypothetical protein